MSDQLNIQEAITELEARLKRLDTERAEVLQKLRDLYTGSPQAEKPSAEAAHNISKVDNLFLAMPFSFKGKMIQYTGRLYRQYKGKSEIRIYDYVDRNVAILSGMYRRRLKTYKLLEYVDHTLSCSRQINIE